jgi:hypothetical protein
MATHSYTIYIEELDLEVELEAEITLENDGIGSYEYWGMKCYDAGTDYYEVTGLEYDQSLYSKEQIEVIEKYLDDNIDEINTTIVKEYEKNNDY